MNVPRGLGRLALFAKPVDDRGRAIPHGAAADAMRSVRQRTPARVWLLAAALGGYAIYIFGTAVAAGNFGAAVPMGWSVVVPMVSVGVFVAGTSAYRASGSWGRPARELLPMASAWLAACGRCGACGYDLRSIGAEEDGCAVCPECGCAWHVDRRTLEHEDPSNSPRSLADLYAEDAGVVVHRMPIGKDDRNVPLKAPLADPPLWLDSGKVSRERYDAFKRAYGRGWAYVAGRRAGAFGGVLGIAAVLTFLAMVLGAFAPGVLFAVVVIVPNVGLVALAILALRRGRRTVPRVKRAAIAAGLCAGCGGELDAARPGFDGCVGCGGCGRAWRVGVGGVVGAGRPG